MKQGKNVVLLVNLGSPNNLSVSSIRRFLRVFLSDRRVVNLSRIIWLPILYGIILPLRAKRLLGLYQKIWLTKTNQSPLVFYTEQQAKLLASLVAEAKLDDIMIEYAFCYSNPTIDSALTNLQQKYSLSSLLVIPLYPQASSTTTMAVFDQIHKFYQNKYKLPSLKFISGFATDPHYINAIGSSIKQSFVQNGQMEKLIFSYHALPVALIEHGDSYYAECVETSKLLAEYLGIAENEYVIAFQSKFGKAKWLEPQTSEVLAHMARSGIKKIDIVCPGFVSDCLETLEEINILNRQIFMANGGEVFNYINALNTSPELIKTLFFMLQQKITRESK